MDEHYIVESFAWFAICVYLIQVVIKTVKYFLFVPKCNLDASVDNEALRKILEGITKSEHGD
jgi:hypothetical protein